MKKIQRTYTQEFKLEAVRLAQTSGKPIAHMARELGISDASIHQWRKELAAHGAKRFQAVDIKRPRRRNCVASNGNSR